MVPIVISQDLNFDQNSFEDYLIGLANKHREEGRALAFSFIIYDFHNHVINGILEKKNYWNSLDNISGKHLSVFYLNSQDSYYERRQKEIYEDKIKQLERRNKQETFSFLIPITPEPTPVDKTKDYISKLFDLEDDISLPLVLFFQLEDDKISDSFIVGLKNEKLEDAFIELRDHIKNAVDALKDVEDEYKGNHQEIFELIRVGVVGGKWNKIIKKTSKNPLFIKTVFLIVKMIAGGT
jgi:hypothetical protein